MRSRLRPLSGTTTPPPRRGTRFRCRARRSSTTRGLAARGPEGTAEGVLPLRGPGAPARRTMATERPIARDPPTETDSRVAGSRRGAPPAAASARCWRAPVPSCPARAAASCPRRAAVDGGPSTVGLRPAGQDPGPCARSPVGRRAAGPVRPSGAPGRPGSKGAACRRPRRTTPTRTRHRHRAPPQPRDGAPPPGRRVAHDARRVPVGGRAPTQRRNAKARAGSCPQPDDSGSRQTPRGSVGGERWPNAGGLK